MLNDSRLRLVDKMTLMRVHREVGHAETELQRETQECSWECESGELLRDQRHPLLKRLVLIDTAEKMKKVKRCHSDFLNYEPCNVSPYLAPHSEHKNSISSLQLLSRKEARVSIDKKQRNIVKRNLCC